MKKLLKLKSWLTLPEAAKHLSTVLSEDVTEADILQLGLEMQLTLSVNLVNHAFAKIGKIIPLSECESEEIPAFRPTDKTITFYPNAVKLNDGTAVKLQPDVKSIAGLWDLPMIGGEYHTISNRYHQLTGGPVTELIAIDGTFVRSSDGAVAQLLERQSNRKLSDDQFDCFPAGELPDDCAIVVRPQCLRDLEARIAEQEAPNTTSTRADNSLQKLVIGMAIGGYGYDPIAKKSPIPAEITADLEKLGLSIDADTVRKWLKEGAKHL